MSRQGITRAVLGCGTAVAMALLLSMTAAAHERREVAGGQFQMVVGFLNEPAFAGEQNGLDLRVTKPLEGAGAATAVATPGVEAERTPIEGLADTLQAEVIFGDQTMVLELRPRFRDPGAYAGDFFPSTPGDYTYHIFGTIEGVAIDERFTSSPETFGAVQDPAPLTFPMAAASTDDGQALASRTVGTIAGGLGAVVMVTGAGVLFVRRAVSRRSATVAERQS